MNIHVVLIAYALDIYPLVRAIEGPDTLIHLFTHSQRPDVLSTCRDLAQFPVVRLYDYGTNRGLARSWNEGIEAAMREKADAVIVVNDDVSMSREDLLLLAQGCVEHREAGIIEAEGYNERMVEHQILQFACFGINPIAIEKVGYFDENFFPIYFEDSDYSRRAFLAGLPYHNVGPSGMVHRGSTTINSVPELHAQNNATFSACNTYYRLKWGGDPGSETLNWPFDNPGFGLRIAPEERSNPYPGYERTDMEIVKL